MKTKPKMTPKAAARKPARKGGKAQFERFVETARQIGVDESPDALERAFDKIAPPRSDG